MTKINKCLQIMMALGVLTLGACQQEKITEGEQIVPLELLITNISNNIVYPTVKELNANAIELNESTKKYCTDLEALNNQTIEAEENIDESINNLRKAPQEKWKKVMSQFHRYEVMQYGPAKSPLSTTINSLYTFDYIHKCKVIINISRNVSPNLNATDDEDYKLIGLDTIEALLFTDLNKSLCPRELPWDRKSVLEKQIAVCNYTSQLTGAVVSHTKEMDEEWAPQKGDYNSQILTANALGSNENAVNQISQALFYLYGGIVDAKVTVPAGIQVFNDRVESCDQSCPDRTEHQYSGQSIESIISALEGFYYLFNGINPVTNKNGISFDDILISKKHNEVVTGINSAMEKALANYKRQIGINTLTTLAQNVDMKECLKTTSENRLVEICALNKDIELVTNYLQEMEVLLKGILSRPTSQQGDND